MFNIEKIIKFKTDLLDEDGLIIVEGVNDKKQLSLLGLENVMDISGNSLDAIVEKVKSRNTNPVTILTDFDREGEEKASLLEKMLNHDEIKTLSEHRNRFRNLFHVSHIEDITPVTKLITSSFMEESFNGKISSVYNKISNRGRVLVRRNSGKA